MRVGVCIIAFLLCIPVISTYAVAEDGTYYRVDNVYLNATVNDKDNDLMHVAFFWGNYSDGIILEEFFNVTNGTSLSVFLPEHLVYQVIINGVSYDVTWLEHSHRYYWYLIGDDGKNVTAVQNFFDTGKAWDLNSDKAIDYLDFSLLVSHYGSSVLPSGEDPWDINEDTYTNYLDLSLLVNHYGETY